VVDEAGAEHDLGLRVVVEVGQGGAAVVDAGGDVDVVDVVRGPQPRAGVVDRVQRALAAALAAGVDDVGQRVAADVADREGRAALRAVLLLVDVGLDDELGGPGLAVEHEDRADGEVGRLVLGGVDDHLGVAVGVEVGDRRGREDLVLDPRPLGHRGDRVEGGDELAG
jgi:hypothetical protein